MGAKTAASLLAGNGSLDALLAAGRFSAEADALRMYRHIATLDATAPVPPLPDREPDWHAAAVAADELGLGGSRGGSRRLHRADLPPGAGAPTSDGAPSPSGAARATRRAPRGSRRRSTRPPATRAQIERVHDPAYVDLIASLDEETWLDGDTLGGPIEAARLAAGCAIEAVESGGSRSFGRRASRVARPCDGLLPVRQRRGRRPARAGRLGIERVAIVDWDVHHGNGTDAIFRGDDSVFVVSLHQWPFYPGSGGPGTSDESTLNVPSRRAPATTTMRPPSTSWWNRPGLFDPELVLVSAGFDAHVDDPLAGMAVTERGFTELARRLAQLGPRAAAVLEGGYNLATLPRLVEAAIAGFDAA